MIDRFMNIDILPPVNEGDSFHHFPFVNRDGTVEMKIGLAQP
jgi:hypothetical protein